MTNWIEVGGQRYEQVGMDSLDLMQLMQASRELGVSPRDLERAALGVDVDDYAATSAATAVLIWAARLAAGETHRTVASAVAGVALADIDFGSDDPPAEPEPEQAPDPTAAASDPVAADAETPTSS